MKSWEQVPFDLLVHAEGHYRKDTSSDARLALISFDNAIELTISCYLNLNPDQRNGVSYPKKKLKGWLDTKNTYHPKIEFFLSLVAEKELPLIIDKSDFVFLHQQRSNHYHDGNNLGQPSRDVMDQIRKASLWVFSIIFDKPDIEKLINDVLDKKDQAVSKIPDDLYVPKSVDVEQTNTVEQTNALAIMSLLGSWNENNTFDKKIVRKLAIDYSFWIMQIREVNHNANEEILFNNGIWQVTKRKEFWEKFGPRIFDEDLDRFQKYAVKVLKEIDPKFELPIEERYMASIYNKELKYSPDLRKGIVDSLALLGNHGNNLVNCLDDKSNRIVFSILHKILHDADYQLWGSLSHLLPTIAESSPKAFLKIVEDTLQRSPCPFKELFSQEGTGIDRQHYMSGLYWALESLAWQEEYLVQVAVILAELKSHDLEVKSDNHSISSLTTILLPWQPQTLASIDKRLSSIKAIYEDFPDVAWSILLNLLPNQNQFSTGTYKPRWINIFPKNWKLEVTHVEYHKQVRLYSELIFDIACKDPVKLGQLITNFDNLPKNSLNKVLEYLASNATDDIPDIIRLTIWENLIAFKIKHRKYSDAGWALDSEKVDQIEAVAKGLLPTTPEGLYRRLFGNKNHDLFEGISDFEEQRKELDDKRINAVKEILDKNGFDGVMSFMENVDSPNILGWTLGLIKNDEIDKKLLPSILDNKDLNTINFVKSFVGARQKTQGYEWVDKLDRASWSSVQNCQFLMYLPFANETWGRAKSWLDDENTYWKKVPISPFYSGGDLLLATKKLLKVKRPNYAIDCLYYYLEDGHKIKSKLIVKALIDSVSASNIDTFHVIELIKAIQNDPNTKENDLFQIEWRYLPLLDGYHGCKPTILERHLATKPKLFCDVIRKIYRSENSSEQQEDIDNKMQEELYNYHRLLRVWKTPPGQQEDGSFLFEDFKKWFKTVKKICNNSGHLNVAMSEIGKILIYCPPAPDGQWIVPEIAKVLNVKDANVMRDGYCVEIYNSRGTHTVDPSGKEERDLAAKWKERSEIVEAWGYSRFATALMNISDTYINEAKRVSAEFGGK